MKIEVIQRMGNTLMSLVLSLVLIFFLNSVAQAQSRGYQARACGFDMNRNGIFSESADCRVCDASVSGGLVQAGTTDPDGDGVAEDLLYVDCQSGSNQANCGKPGNPPCRSISYAYNTISDGPGDGAEDIICFRGTCAQEGNSFLLKHGGISNNYSVPPTGNQVRAFPYPKNPAMIVGWDFDRDGKYPPFDADDIAVLDGSVNNYSTTFGRMPSYIELAHFSVKDYGDDENLSNTPRGFVENVTNYNFYHDLELNGINENSCQGGSSITFGHSAGPIALAIQNIHAKHVGGYFARGTAGAGPTIKGPLRYQNISFTAVGINDPSNVCGSGGEKTDFFKLWGYFSGIEVLDNKHKCDVVNWHGALVRSPCRGITSAQCTQDWDIVNNEFQDVSTALNCQGTDPQCTGRSVDDILWDRNLFVNTRLEPQYEGSEIVNINSFGNTPAQVCENMQLTNNIFHWENPEWTFGVMYQGSYTGSGSTPGKLTIANNTFSGPIKQPDGPYFSGSYRGYITLDGAYSGKRHDNVVIQNNIFRGSPAGSDCANIYLDYAPQSATINNNVYDSDCNFAWNSAQTGFTGWKTTSGADGNSFNNCDPIFVNAANDDFHLALSDTCARNRGANLSSVYQYDFDKVLRPASGSWDIGADQTGNVDTLAPAAPGSLQIN